MYPTHIVFDLDGTLVNSLEDVALGMNEALESCGFSALPLNSYHDLVGWGIHRLAERALAAQNVGPGQEGWTALVDTVAKEAMKNYNEEPIKFSKPYPGIPELLHRLIDDELVLAVLTNKPDPVARQVVTGLFPDVAFSLVRGDLPGQSRKPDPDFTRTLMKELGAPVPATLFVGDSIVDVQTAHNVGCPVVGVSWGFRGPEELVAAGADHIIQEPGELLTYLRTRAAEA